MHRAASALPPSSPLHRASFAARRAVALPLLLAGLCAAAASACSPSKNAAARETNGQTTADSAASPPLSADSVLAVADTQTGAVSAGPTPQGEPTLPSQVTAAAARAAARRPVVALSPLADSIAGSLVFAPRTQVWFAAASRGKRMLIDLGRVDTDVKKTPERLAAYKEAVAARTVVAPDAHFRLHGGWGVEEVTIGDYDVWNGRIVGVAQGSAVVDSLARRAGATASAPVVTAAAELVAPPSYAAADTSTVTTATPPADSNAATPTVAAPLPTHCVRDSASTPLATRAAEVRDSLDLLLRQTAMPPYEEVAKTVTIQSSQVIGCFLPAAVAASPNAPAPRPAAVAASATNGATTVTPARGLLLAVSLRDAGREFLRERLVLIDDATGAVTPLRVADLRFKAHDLIAAYDADGDGIDDVAARGLGEASGGTVVLRFDPTAKKFLRLASGFAWESR